MSLAQIVIPVADLAISRDWYLHHFGMTLEFEAPNVAALRLDGVRYLLSTGGKPDPEASGVLLYFTSSDIQADYARLQGPGSAAPHVIARMAGTDIHIATVRDPAGLAVGLYQAVPVAG